MSSKPTRKRGFCTIAFSVLLVLIISVLPLTFASLDVPVTYTVKPSQQTKILSFSSFNFVFTNASIRATEDKPTLLVTLQPLNREPIAKFVLPKRVYQYVTFDANQTITPKSGIFVSIEFSVPREWVVRAGSTPQDVKLFYFGSDGWETVQTEYVRISDNSYLYKANPNRFGFFAVALETSSQVPVAAIIDENPVEVKPNEQGRSELISLTDSDLVYPSSDVSQSMNLQILLGYGLLIFAATGVLIIGISYIVPSKKKEFDSNAMSKNAQASELVSQFQKSSTQASYSTKSQEKISSMVHLLEKQIAQKKTPVTTQDVTSLLASVRSKYENTSSAVNSIQNAASVASSTQTESPSHDLALNLRSRTPEKSAPERIQSQMYSQSQQQDAIESVHQEVENLEPSLARRYVAWARSQGLDEQAITTELKSYHMSDSIISQALRFDDESQKSI